MNLYGSLNSEKELHPQLQSRSMATDVETFSRRFAEVQENLRQPPYRIGLPGIALGMRYVNTVLPVPSEFWILPGSPQDRGRISANLSPFYRENGYLGFFEADSFESARQLIEQGVAWLQNRGAKKILGPIHFNTWLSYRFRVDTDTQSPAFAFEPNQPPEYPLWWRELGFSEVAGYHTDGLDGLEGILRQTQVDYANALRQGFRIRKLDAAQLLEKEVPILYEISMQAFKKNHLFEPVPFEFFRELYVPFARKLDSNSQLAYFVCNSEGKEIGYFFNFIESEHLIIKTAGLLPEGRGHRLSNAMLYQAVQESYDRGIRKSVTALMHHGIQSESYSKKQEISWQHRYSLFGKSVANMET